MAAVALPTGLFQIRCRGRFSNTWHHLFKENCTTSSTLITHPSFSGGFSRLQMPPLRDPSPFLHPSLLLCREEGILRHLVSNTLHHRLCRCRKAAPGSEGRSFPHFCHTQLEPVLYSPTHRQQCLADKFLQAENYSYLEFKSLEFQLLGGALLVKLVFPLLLCWGLQSEQREHQGNGEMHPCNMAIWLQMD